MAEFIRTEEKVVNVNEPVIFENNTDSDFSVSAAIVFRKSGLYDVSIVGRRTIISKVAERPKGKWVVDEKRFGDDGYHCDQCGAILEGDAFVWRNNYYCYHCGADMRGEQDD